MLKPYRRPVSMPRATSQYVLETSSLTTSSAPPPPWYYTNTGPWPKTQRRHAHLAPYRPCSYRPSRTRTSRSLVRRHPSQSRHPATKKEMVRTSPLPCHVYVETPAQLGPTMPCCQRCWPSGQWSVHPYISRSSLTIKLVQSRLSLSFELQVPVPSKSRRVK